VSGDDLDKIVFLATFGGALPMFVIFHVNVHKACLFCEAQASALVLLQE